MSGDGGRSPCAPNPCYRSRSSRPRWSSGCGRSGRPNGNGAWSWYESSRDSSGFERDSTSGAFGDDCYGFDGDGDSDERSGIGFGSSQSARFVGRSGFGVVPFDSDIGLSDRTSTGPNSRVRGFALWHGYAGCSAVPSKFGHYSGPSDSTACAYCRSGAVKVTTGRWTWTRTRVRSSRGSSCRVGFGRTSGHSRMCSGRLGHSYCGASDGVTSGCAASGCGSSDWTADGSSGGHASADGPSVVPASGHCSSASDYPSSSAGTIDCAVSACVSSQATAGASSGGRGTGDAPSAGPASGRCSSASVGRSRFGLTSAYAAIGAASSHATYVRFSGGRTNYGAHSPVPASAACLSVVCGRSTPTAPPARGRRSRGVSSGPCCPGETFLRSGAHPT